MPRRVDHHARRKQLADALMRLAATRGLEAVSLRHVAAEAGVSTGMVQHYFRTKDEMMTFALDMVMQNVQARTTTDAHRPDGPGGIVRTLLLQILPLDEPRRLENHVVLAFLAYAAVKPAIASGLRESVHQMRMFIADQIRVARAGTDTAPPIDPDQAATGLLALVDGLGIQVLGLQCAPDEAVAVLDTHLRTLFGTTDDAPHVGHRPPGDREDDAPTRSPGP